METDRARQFPFLRTMQLVWCLFALSVPAGASELRVMSPIALKPLFEKAGPELERATGDTLRMSWGETGGMRADIQNGVAFDIAVLTANFIDDFIKEGKLDGASKRLIARSGIGVAVRKGAPIPDLSTTEAFKTAMLNATTIGFAAESATSRYLDQLFKRLGISEDVKSKLRPLQGTVAPYMAKGDPQIGLTQISTIIPFEGVDFAGPLPPDIQLYTVFAAAASPAANPEATKALLTLLASRSNAPILKKVGLDQTE